MHAVWVVLQSVLVALFSFLSLQKIRGVKQQIEIFEQLKLPQWFRVVTGWTQLIGVIAMVIGYWVSEAAIFAGVWLGFVMMGAIIAHFRAKDAFSKVIPAFVLAVVAFMVAVIRFSEW